MRESRNTVRPARRVGLRATSFAVAVAVVMIAGAAFRPGVVGARGLAQSGGGTAPTGDRSPAYDRVLRKAVAEADRRTESATSLWVDRTLWENAWEVQGQHFTVRTTRGYDFGTRVVAGLEQMHGWFSFVLGRGLPEGDRVNVWILPDLTGYNELGDDLSGDHSSKIGCFYAPGNASRPVVTYYLRDELRGRQFATHGSLHAFLDRAFPRVTVPLWLDEGLACYFELHWRYPDTVTAWRAFKDRGAFIPLASLRDAPLSVYTPDHFLELSMLVYYLLWDCEETRIRWNSETRSVDSWPARDWIVHVLTTGSTDGTFEEGSDLATVQALMTTGLTELEAAFRAHGFDRKPGWESL